MSLSTIPSEEDVIPAPVRAVAPYLALILVIFTVYGNAFDNVFVFDDDLLIKMNSYLLSWSHLGDILTGSTTGGVHIIGGFYRPLQIFLYLLIVQLGGGTVFWFHLLNITLHVINACFMYRIGTKLGFSRPGVFLASLIWAVHPLHTEAVTYMSATADPLFAFFSLAAISYLLPDITARKILIIFPLFLLGLVSKETMVMFPLLVMACLFYVSPERLTIRPYLRTWPLWLVTLIYVFWRTHATGFDGPQTYGRFYALPEFSGLRMYAEHPLDRIYTFLATLPAYLKLLLWPTGLHMERSFSIFTQPYFRPVVSGAIILALAMAQVIHTYRRPTQGRALSWGILWFMAAHAPDTGILIPMNSLFLEHWMYLPTVGLFLGLGELLSKTLAHKPKTLGIACCLAALSFTCVLSAKTYHQNLVWRDPDTFYNNIFAYGEISARSRNNLALYYSDRGQYEAAVTQFKEAIKISDSYAETEYNLALTYSSMPDKAAHVQDMIDCLKRSIEIQPDFFRSYEALGNIYSKTLNDKKTADIYYKKGAELVSPPQ